MSFPKLLEAQRQKINMSFERIADELSRKGYTVTRQAVALWASGDRRPDISKPSNLRALSLVLRVSALEILEALGYYKFPQNYSPEAQYAAEIIERLPEDKRRLAVGILERIAEG